MGRRAIQLQGAITYAAIVAVVLAFVGSVDGNQHPLSFLRALVPVYRPLDHRKLFERFFEAPAAAATTAAADAPNKVASETPMADSMIRSARAGRRPRGLANSPEPVGSPDTSAVAQSAASAKFVDDVKPPEYSGDDQGGAVSIGDDEGGVRFSRLLEFRTREDLFLACRLRSQQHKIDADAKPQC